MGNSSTPDLAAFLAAHAKPYDPEGDSYRRAPFAQPVKEGRSGSLYNAHSYHTKVPPQGIVPYIEHYTDPGDLVLDPFCGSGMTGVAALMAGRHAILSDLSPAAVHIARNYCTPVDTAALRQEFERIKAAVKDEFDWLYGTTCDRCGGPAMIQYTIWSDVFECGRCGGELVLWEVAVDQASGKVAESFTCPTCGASWRKTQLHWLRPQPVVTNYECSQCKPRRAEHPTTTAEKQRIAEIEAAAIPYWYPTTPFLEADWEMWRGVHKDQSISDVSRFYTPRNLWSMSRLWREIGTVEDSSVMSHLRFAFTAIALGHTPKTARIIFKAGTRPILTSAQTGTLYLPSYSVEKNVLAVFERKLDDIVDANLLLVTFQDRGVSVSVTTGSATHLILVSNSTVDYIFTDPPFGSNIFYADCNLIWEAWLDQGFTDQGQEAVVHLKHKNRNTLPDYARLMTESFREMYRVLKPGRWASVVFHNSDDKIWQTILDAAEAAGFELAEINAFDKEQLSFKGIRGQKGLERVTNEDIVLNLHKPKPGAQAAANGKVYADESERQVVEAIAAFLDAGPAASDRTLQGLWNRALHHMLREGSVQVSMAQVGEMLPHYFKQVDGAWYLRGEAVVGGNVFDLKSDAGAITWLTAVLSAEPQTTGNLIPLWQKETAHMGGADPGRLERLLAENFWPEPRSGRWRLPTDAEREKMSARQSLADQAHLRVVRRYLDGQLDRRPTDLELSAWLRFCYNRQAYAEAVALFPQIQPDRLEPQDYAELKKIVAVSRRYVAG